MEARLLGALNLISVLTAVGSFSIFIVTYLFTDDYVYMAINLSVTFTYLLLVVLHHFHLIRIARLYFSTFIPLWYVFAMLAIGGNFSQSIAATATIVITFLMFRNEKKLRNFLIIYNIILFIIPSLYITFKEPFFGTRNYPIDEIVVFSLCIGWISIIFYYYEQATKSHIHSLESKNKELNQKTIELERFTHIVSHDLKSPLRNIISFLGLSRKSIKKENYQSLPEYIDYAIVGAKQMNELIQGVLEVTRIDRGLEVENRTTINLNKCIEKALLNLQEDIENTGTEINVDKLPHYFCNETHFILIFQNIIQNAIKYNESTPPVINIRSKVEGKYIHITIEDNGIGIEKEFHEQIFVFFKRLHNPSEYPGTGLGLGLVKKLVEQYSGSITVQSTPGEYSVFKLKLPL
ncbi:MAG: ATP-binding protein [Bacteroidota bacterium]